MCSHRYRYPGPPCHRECDERSGEESEEDKDEPWCNHRMPWDLKIDHTRRLLLARHRRIRLAIERHPHYPLLVHLYAG